MAKIEGIVPYQGKTQVIVHQSSSEQATNVNPITISGNYEHKPEEIDINTIKSLTTFIDTIVKQTQKKIQASRTENPKNKIPIFVSLPHTYYRGQVPVNLKKKLKMDTRTQFTIANWISKSLEQKLSSNKPSIGIEVGGPLEYRTADTDKSDNCYEQIFVFNQIPAQQRFEHLKKFLSHQAQETADEIKREFSNNPNLWRNIRTIYWGTEDRPIYRLMQAYPVFSETYTKKIQELLNLAQEPQVVLPKPDRTGDKNQASPSVIVSPETATYEGKTTSVNYKYPAIYAYIKDDHAEVRVSMLNNKGDHEPDNQTSWQMPSADLNNFTQELFTTISEVTKNFKLDNPNTNYKIPVYLDWPKGIALPDNIRQQMGAQDTPVLFSFNPSSTPHNTSCSLIKLLTSYGQIYTKKLLEITETHYQAALEGDKRSLRYLVRLARFLALFIAEESKKSMTNYPSQLLTFGQKEDHNFVKMLDFPEVKTAIAQEFIRIHNLPYTPDEMIIKLGDQEVSNSEDIVILQARKRINALNGNTQTPNNSGEKQLEALYEDQLPPTPNPSLRKLNTNLIPSETNFPQFYGVGISGFTNTLTYTKLAGRGELDLREIEGSFQKNNANIFAELDNIAQDLKQLALIQFREKKLLGYPDYKIPIALGWPDDDSQNELRQELIGFIRQNSGTSSTGDLNKESNATLVSGYIILKLRTLGLNNPLGSFKFFPRGFYSVEKDQKQHAQSSARTTYDQFIPQIDKGWQEFRKGNMQSAYEIFREVTRKCADLYILQLQLLKTVPGFALFGTSFNKPTLRKFEFLKLFDLRRFFERIVEQDIGKPGYRFRLKLKSLDLKGPQFSDPVKSHMTTEMHNIGYTRDIFQLKN